MRRASFPLILVLLVAGGCGREAPPNVLLISIDTLRADHLGAYGYDRPTSPHLDAFAQHAVRFDAAYAPAPWTLPSHAGLLTGVHPYLLGIRGAQATLPAGVPTLAEGLAAAGYQSAAFVDSAPRGYVGAERGFGRGFGEYHHLPHRRGRAGRGGHDVAATVDAALEWLGHRDAKRPFFLFLHTKSVHALPIAAPCTDEHCFPYDKPEPWRSRFHRPNDSTRGAARVWSEPGMGHGQAYLWSLDQAFQAGRRDGAEIPEPDRQVLRDLYDAGIAYTDEQLGRLLGELERSGLAATTLVVITSDHGEAFLDHQLLMHQEVYEPLLRVPLLVRAPGERAGRVEARPVALEDVAPTVLGLAGRPVPPLVTGLPLPLVASRSLALGAGAPARERELFAYYELSPPFDYRAASLRVGDWKLVAHNFRQTGQGETVELYHLSADPGEASPSADEAVRRRLLARLRAWQARPPLAAGEALAGGDELKAIEASGYVD